MMDAQQFMAFQIGWFNAKYIDKQITRKERDESIEKFRQLLRIKRDDLESMKKQLIQGIINIDKYMEIDTK